MTLLITSVACIPQITYKRKESLITFLALVSPMAFPPAIEAYVSRCGSSSSRRSIIFSSPSSSYLLVLQWFDHHPCWVSFRPFYRLHPLPPQELRIQWTHECSSSQCPWFSRIYRTPTASLHASPLTPSGQRISVDSLRGKDLNI